MGLTFSNTSCFALNEIYHHGKLVENLDGTVSVYMPGAGNVLQPVVLSQQCCLGLNSGYTFDVDSQQCRWTASTECNIENVFKMVLNPSGNDGAIFYVANEEDCSLKVEFDFLFKITCETLNSFLQTGSTVSQTTQQIVFLESEIGKELAKCDLLESQINIIQSQIATTPYAIKCNMHVAPVPYNFTGVTAEQFNNTGFGDNTNGNIQNIVGLPPINDLYNKTFCLTEPSGLLAWSNILGPSEYQLFLSGISNYDCTHVDDIFNQNVSLLLNNPQATPLLDECTIGLNDRPFLEAQLKSLLNQYNVCSSFIETLTAELNILKASAATDNISMCMSPIDMFELLDVSLLIDVVTSANTLNTVYQDNSFFEKIGSGNLYDYIRNNQDSGFYVCGGVGCKPLDLDLNTPNLNNDVNCTAILGNLLTDLFVESELAGQPNGVSAFTNSIPDSAFTSNWLHYSKTITDTDIIAKIKNNKIKLSLKINHSCGPICILLDNINISKDCTIVDDRTIFVTKSPGFDLERIRDNKKSWVDTTTNRTFEIDSASGGNTIRETSYDVDDERLILNTKEIDLDINLASGIETDVWGYILNNPCILTGATYCDPCGYKEFQDDFSFEFQDDEPYNFMGSDPSIVGNEFSCCGDNLIDFTSLLSQPYSAITTVEDFKYFLTSELIDAKNRQTLSSYPTLRALYDRYLNSSLFCNTNSSAFNYLTMEQFATLVGDYWVDIVEQVVPSTTIWGSVKIYSNTIFHQQKFKYRTYTSLFCNNPFFGKSVSSPIFGTSGLCADIEVSLSTINNPTSTATTISIPPAPIVCDSVCLAQMNIGSEFIGNVQIMGRNTSCGATAIKDCDLQVGVNVSGLTAYTVLVGAETPVSYLWSNGDINPTTTFSGSGVYNVTVVDGRCCSVTKGFVVN